MDAHGGSLAVGREPANSELHDLICELAQIDGVAPRDLQSIGEEQAEQSPAWIALRRRLGYVFLQSFDWSLCEASLAGVSACVSRQLHRNEEGATIIECLGRVRSAMARVFWPGQNRHIPTLARMTDLWPNQWARGDFEGRESLSLTWPLEKALRFGPSVSFEFCEFPVIEFAQATFFRLTSETLSVFFGHSRARDRRMGSIGEAVGWRRKPWGEPAEDVVELFCRATDLILGLPMGSCRPEVRMSAFRDWGLADPMQATDWLASYRLRSIGRVVERIAGLCPRGYLRRRQLPLWQRIVSLRNPAIVETRALRKNISVGEWVTQWCGWQLAFAKNGP